MKNAHVVVLLLLICTIAATLIAAQAVMQANIRFSSVGAVKSLGVEVYWDENCTNAVAAIDWGIIEPNSTSYRTIYVRNSGNSGVNLWLKAENFVPISAAQVLNLFWDYDNGTIQPKSVIKMVLGLAVAENANITSFSFDIVIAAYG
jgi:hypothetical protein